MATIEPRLMHLLNNTNASPETSYYPPPPDLPPIQSFSSFAKSSSISLPPLEPDACNSVHEKPASSKTIHQIPSLASIREEYNGARYSHDGGSGAGPSRQNHSGGISLRMLFDSQELNESSHSLNHILDDVPEPPSATSTVEDVSTKKRHRAMTVKDDIMHLPQPLKKQKSTQNISQNIMPPIINGLYEPPPNAAVFPPIALDDCSEGVTPASLHALNQMSGNSTSIPANNVEAPPEVPEMGAQYEARQDSVAPPTETERPLARVKRKAAKPRKKWSEEETKHLLLGVSKYGVGKWTSILEDPEYRFNGRTAGDLKDRFRTCCPDELRVVPSKSRESLQPQDKPASLSPAEPRPKGKSKTALLLEDILADPSEEGYQTREEPVLARSSSQTTLGQAESDSTTKPKKSRAHRKKIEDLQAMGIHGPFKKSHRRERRPFTQQDDDQILEGLQLYGPAWTKIQRDPRFDLSTRQPTDLRDRVRNKYPDMYKHIEEKQGQHSKEHAAIGPALPSRPAPSARNNNIIMEPSVSNLINDNSLMTLEPHLRRSGSREDVMMPKWAGSIPTGSASHVASGSGSFHELPGMDSFSRDPLDGDVVEGGEPSASGAFSGMMDISRLLLDE